MHNRQKLERRTFLDMWDLCFFLEYGLTLSRAAERIEISKRAAKRHVKRLTALGIGLRQRYRTASEIRIYGNVYELDTGWRQNLDDMSNGKSPSAVVNNTERGEPRHFNGNPLGYLRDNIREYAGCYSATKIHRNDIGLYRALRRAGQMEEALAELRAAAGTPAPIAA